MRSLLDRAVWAPFLCCFEGLLEGLEGLLPLPVLRGRGEGLRFGDGGGVDLRRLRFGDGGVGEADVSSRLTDLRSDGRPLTGDAGST